MHWPNRSSAATAERGWWGAERARRFIEGFVGSSCRQFVMSPAAASNSMSASFELEPTLAGTTTAEVRRIVKSESMMRRESW